MSAAYPAEGLALTPEKASLPPHCMPISRSLRGSSSRRRSFSRASFLSAMSISAFMQPSKPWHSWSTTTFSGVLFSGPTSISTVSFSHPRLTTISSPPKLG